MRKEKKKSTPWLNKDNLYDYNRFAEAVAFPDPPQERETSLHSNIEVAQLKLHQ